MQTSENTGLNEIIFPIGEIEEVSRLTVDMANRGAEDIILNIAKRYDATQAIVAKLRVRYGYIGRVVDVEGQVFGNGSASPFYLRLPYGDDVPFETILSQASDAFYARLDEDRQQSTLVDVDRPDRIFLRFRPESLNSLIDLEKRIKEIDRVRQYKLRAVSVEDSIFQVDFFGDKSQFQSQLENSGVVVSPTSMDTVWSVSLKENEFSG